MSCSSLLMTCLLSTCSKATDRFVAALALSVLLLPAVNAFASCPSLRCRMHMVSQQPHTSGGRGLPESRAEFLRGLAGGAIVALTLPLAAIADPPLEKFTQGEICVERNLVGACTKFGISDATDEATTVVKKSAAPEEPESELMTTLKRRTVENKARNDEEIATKTFVNGQSGEFGPFSRYVPVKHKDTERFELVLVSELKEMKRNGLIVSERGQDYFAEKDSE